MAKLKNDIELEEVTSVTATKVEAIADEDGRHKYTEREKYISEVVVPKYKDKYIAIVYEEDARQAFRGWVPLALNYQSGTVTPVKTFEEAERWKAKSLLCWKDIRIKENEDREWRKVQNRNNRFVAEQSPEKIAGELNQQFGGDSGIRFKGVVNDED